MAIIEECKNSKKIFRQYPFLNYFFFLTDSDRSFSGHLWVIGGYQRYVANDISKNVFVLFRKNGVLSTWSEIATYFSDLLFVQVRNASCTIRILLLNVLKPNKTAHSAHAVFAYAIWLTNKKFHSIKNAKEKIGWFVIFQSK